MLPLSRRDCPAEFRERDLPGMSGRLQPARWQHLLRWQSSRTTGAPGFTAAPTASGLPARHTN